MSDDPSRAANSGSSGQTSREMTLDPPPDQRMMQYPSPSLNGESQQSPLLPASASPPPQSLSPLSAIVQPMGSYTSASPLGTQGMAMPWNSGISPQPPRQTAHGVPSPAALASAAAANRAQQTQQAQDAQGTQLYNDNATEPFNAASELSRIAHVVKDAAVKVTHLDNILRNLNLSRNGVKKVKQERLLYLAQQYFNSRDFENLVHLRQVVDACSPWGDGRPPQRVVQPPMTYTQAVNSINSPTPSRPVATAPNPLVAKRASFAAHTPLSFQNSPFYSLDTPLASPLFFMRPYTRRRVQQTSRFRIALSALRDDTSRVYLVSQQFLPQAQNLRPVYFPFYVDIVLDDREVKANTRGVRGNIGSAKPVDLTSYVKNAGNDKTRSLTVTIHVSDQNQYDTVSDKSFAMGVYFGHKTPLEKLVNIVKERRHITIEQTKDYLQKAALDEDGIESTAMRYSLRDAVMRTRIKHPVRSQLCEHIDCFDAESFFMLQDQAETWKCPVCNRKITFDSLLFDDFFMAILSKTPDTVDAVEVAPDGEWSVPAHNDDDDSESGESGDGDENQPTAKRARTEPEIEVVDLLSDTDEETPEPVRSIPSRGAFVSNREPTDIGKENSHSANLSDSQAGSQQMTPAEETGSGDAVAMSDQAAARSNGTAPLTTDSLNGSTLDQPPPIDPVGPTSRPSSPFASQAPPPEPRLQIAQMLQSFRGSNSVLFEKSSAVPGYSMLWGRSSENDAPFNGAGSASAETTPNGAAGAAEHSPEVPQRNEKESAASEASQNAPHQEALPEEASQQEALQQEASQQEASQQTKDLARHYQDSSYAVPPSITPSHRFLRIQSDTSSDDDVIDLTGED